jgi:hypothetical protein
MQAQDRRAGLFVYEPALEKRCEEPGVLVAINEVSWLSRLA